MYYRVEVNGKIDASWSDWLYGLQLTSRKDANGAHVTILTGELLDQSALRGLLNHLWDLNLVLLSVERVDPKAISINK
jgi:hypothetical protein